MFGSNLTDEELARRIMQARREMHPEERLLMKEWKRRIGMTWLLSMNPESGDVQLTINGVARLRSWRSYSESGVQSKPYMHRVHHADTDDEIGLSRMVVHLLDVAGIEDGELFRLTVEPLGQVDTEYEWRLVEPHKYGRRRIDGLPNQSGMKLTINGIAFDFLKPVNIVDAEIHCPECGEYIMRPDDPGLDAREHHCLDCGITWWIETTVVRKGPAEEENHA